MKILYAQQFRTIDALSGDTLTLMENAGTRVVEAVEERFDIGNLEIDVLCGKGNNGGDGFVVARLLKERGCRLRVALLARKEDVKGDAAVTLEKLEAAGILPTIILDEKTWSAFASAESPGLIVDALLGTGATRPVEGLYRFVIEDIPESFPDASIVAVDLPSGLVADQAQLIGPALHADVTVTFAALKHCLVFPPAHRLAGDIVVSDIGHLPELLDAPQYKLALNTPDEFQEALHRRFEDTHKGDYGKVLVAAGSRGKTGAAIMAGQSALRAGAGLVTVATPASVLSIVAMSMPELMTEPLEETATGSIANVSIQPLLEGKTVLALGPGIGVDSETRAFARRAIAEATVPVVLDADGLNAFSEHVDELRGSDERPVVITPHPGEMARLIGRTTTYVNANRLEVAREFAANHQVFVVLKGFRSIIATPDSLLFVNGTGNPGMATGGVGDILTGMLAGIIAQADLGPFLQRILLAVHLHGAAGDLAAEEMGEEPLIATDLLRYLGGAWELVRE